MYTVNLGENRLVALERASFSELGLGERRHLQEWLANEPNALGEDLLMIQKEFDGFDETRERLDLLALDREGRLVVIENKLDDTGRDVVWQALKYAAYCSNLKTAQIVEIFQTYLNNHCGGGSAREKIIEFLGIEDDENLVLNQGLSQRIVLVAANFRKEVTATALWLLNSNISIECFKVTPYKLGAEIILDVSKIIPTPEAEEFMIRMSSKESEEKSLQGAQRRSHRMRLEFWQEVLDALRAAGLERYQNIGPGHDNWITTGSGVSGCHYTMIFNQDQIRLEMNFQRTDARENKWFFDQLHAEQTKVEADFGDELEWYRLDDIKASRIKFCKSVAAFDRENWPEMISWFVANNRRFEETFGERLHKLNQQLKVRDGT